MPGRIEHCANFIYSCSLHRIVLFTSVVIYLSTRSFTAGAFVALLFGLQTAFTVAAPVDTTNSALPNTDSINPNIVASTNHGLFDTEVLAEELNIPWWLPLSRWSICASYDPSRPQPVIPGNNGQAINLSKLCKGYLKSSGPAATAPSGSTTPSGSTAPSGSTSLASPPFNPSLTDGSG
ncbi:hypothetical protein EVG20_g6149 [Dentipellis fragilis]|uniref:Uncharacterized protein n=1 Tax=Dentipellis fragilis TaxID=205917 RepID=A0A4Y9YQ18_9AGAM|nr:hypothetical protein EVG20_g6149 [Dentipellis fragilis]